MMLNPDVMDLQLIEALLRALWQLPSVRVESIWNKTSDSSDEHYDAHIGLSTGKKTVTLLVKVKKSVYPRDVRQTLWGIGQIDIRRSYKPENRAEILFLVAESISPGAKELLREECVGYYDSGGSLFLSANEIYIYVDKALPTSMSKSIRSVFSSRRAQVLHVMLLQHREWLGVNEVAEKAEVSPATTSQVLTELEMFDWVESRGKGPSKKRHLKDPGALLDEWVNQMPQNRPPSWRRFFVPSTRIEDLTEKFATACRAFHAEYAITDEVAGQQYSPFLTDVPQMRCRVLASSSMSKVLSSLNAVSADRGANLSIIEVQSPRELLFRNLRNGVWLASVVQVYLDLMRSDGRAKELAKHLRDQVMRF